MAGRPNPSHPRPRKVADPNQTALRAWGAYAQDIANETGEAVQMVRAHDGMIRFTLKTYPIVGDLLAYFDPKEPRRTP